MYSPDDENTAAPTQPCCGARKPFHSEHCPSQHAVQFYSYGWICPVCGRGNAPFSNVCPCQDQISYSYGAGGVVCVPSNFAVG